MIAKSVNEAWALTILNILQRGIEVAPRGIATKELPQHTICVDMLHPVLTIPERKLSYVFMAAEAHWILSGDNTVEGIAPWNKNISKFSDDGVVFTGAYGPPIMDQLSYVIAKLLEDEDTRQAVLTIWRPNPTPTKDYPCTIAIGFQIRRDQLNAHVFMRSSDVWMGVPYDIFNFSMLATLVCGAVNQGRASPLIPGSLYLTAASSHLYAHNWEDAMSCIRNILPTRPRSSTPLEFYKGVGCSRNLLQLLKDLRDTAPGDPLRWWEETE